MPAVYGSLLPVRKVVGNWFSNNERRVAGEAATAAFLSLATTQPSGLPLGQIQSAAGHHKRYRQCRLGLVEDFESEFARCIDLNRVAEAILHAVVLVEGQYLRLQGSKPAFVEVNRVAYNDLVAGLACACGRTIEDAAPRTAFTEDDVGGDARPGILVPDLDELHRQDAGLLTVVRVKSDRPMIVEVRFGDINAMELPCDQLSHAFSHLAVDQVSSRPGAADEAEIFAHGQSTSGEKAPPGKAGQVSHPDGSLNAGKKNSIGQADAFRYEQSPPQGRSLSAIPVRLC